MWYNNEDTNFTKCRTSEHTQYKPNTGRGKTLIVYKKLRYFSITSWL